MAAHEIVFRDRVDAGQQLAQQLQAFADQPAVVILALPRGGVVVASEVALSLHVPLDVLLVRKLGTPWQKEFAFGAVAAGGVSVRNEHFPQDMSLPAPEAERITRHAQQELARQERAYRDVRPTLHLAGQTIILVDDGIATGATIQAALLALRHLSVGRTIIAVPVGALPAIWELQQAGQEVICLSTPAEFAGVGRWYLDFPQVTDGEVRTLLERHKQSSE